MRVTSWYAGSSVPVRIPTVEHAVVTSAEPTAKNAFFTRSFSLGEARPLPLRTSNASTDLVGQLRANRGVSTGIAGACQQ